MPTYDDLIAHFQTRQKEASASATDWIHKNNQAMQNNYWIIENAFKEAVDYLLAQRVDFLGEFDHIKNEKEELSKVTEERGRDVERLTEERDGLARDVERVTKERDARDPGQVRPSDYHVMKASSTKAWPRAIKVVMQKDVYLTIKAEHDQIMNNWVEQRGDGLSSNHYDYLVYSHGVAWEKALKEKKASVENCQDIRKQYMEFMSYEIDD